MSDIRAAEANIEHTARAIIMQGNALLVCQGIDEDFVCLPGGHLDGRESPEQALRREIGEELLGIVTGMVFLGVLETEWYRGGQLETVPVHEVMHLFRVQALFPPVEGVAYRGEAHLRVRWIMASDALKEHLMPLEVIPWIWNFGGAYG